MTSYGGAALSAQTHPAAIEHLPIFITPPGQTDVLFVVTLGSILLLIIVIGTLYLRLHSLPERLAHGTNQVQFQIVAVLALLALFTHNNLFWVLALLLALVRLPDLLTPLSSMARSMERLADRDCGVADVVHSPSGPEKPTAASLPRVADRKEPDGPLAPRSSGAES